jgi:PiT family inorganic phosphate transporter
MAEKKGQTTEGAAEFVEVFDNASVSEKKRILDELKTERKGHGRRKKLKRAYREQLVQRSLLIKIVVAWVVTVPLSGVFAAALFYMVRGYMVGIA